MRSSTVAAPAGIMPAGFAPQGPAVASNSRYWGQLLTLAIILVAVVGARAHEGIPLLSKVRPALLLAAIGGPMAIFKTSQDVVQRALSHPVFRAICAYFGWAALTAPFAMWIGGAVDALKGAYPAVTLVLLVLLCEPTRPNLDKLVRGFVLACAATAMLSMFYNNINSEGRLESPGSLDSNDLAAVMSTAFPLAVGLIVRARWRSKLLWGALAFVLYYTMMKTGSRGGLIAITTSTLVFCLGQRGSRRFGFLAAAAAVFLAAFTFGSQSFRNRVMSIVNREEDYNYTSYFGRKQVWARARGYTLEHPVMGVGMGNFPVAEGESCRLYLRDQGCKWSNTHNSYLQASSELGFPGVALFITCLLVGAKRAFRMWKPRNGPSPWHRPEVLAALCGYAVSAVFLSHAYFYLFFCLLGVIAFAEITEMTELATGGGGMRPYMPVGPPRGVGKRGGLARLHVARGALFSPRA